MSGSKVQWEQQNITNNVKAVLGPKTWSHQNWFHENHESIWATLDAKNKAYAEWQRGPSSTSKVQTELRKMQDLCWQKKAALFRHPQSKTVLQCHKNRLWPIYIRVLPPVVFWRIELHKDQERLNITQQAFHSCKGGSSACLATTSNGRTRSATNYWWGQESISAMNSNTVSGKDSIPAEILKLRASMH